MTGEVIALTASIQHWVLLKVGMLLKLMCSNTPHPHPPPSNCGLMMNAAMRIMSWAYIYNTMFLNMG